MKSLLSLIAILFIHISYPNGQSLPKLAYSVGKEFTGKQINKTDSVYNVWIRISEKEFQDIKKLYVKVGSFIGGADILFFPTSKFDLGSSETINSPQLVKNDSIDIKLGELFGENYYIEVWYSDEKDYHTKAYRLK